MLVTDRIERGEDVARKPVRLVENRGDEIRVEVRESTSRGQIIKTRDALKRACDLVDGGAVGHGR
jgi:hypothetical protein